MPVSHTCGYKQSSENTPKLLLLIVASNHISSEAEPWRKIGFLPLNGSVQELEALPKGSAKSHQSHKANTFMCYQPVGKAVPHCRKVSLYTVSEEG